MKWTHEVNITAMERVLQGTEPAVVEAVRLLGTEDGCLQKAKIRLRYNRNPIVGDKFSSRHGQKGVLSIKVSQLRHYSLALYLPMF